MADAGLSPQLDQSKSIMQLSTVARLSFLSSNLLIAHGHTKTMAAMVVSTLKDTLTLEIMDSCQMPHTLISHLAMRLANLMMVK